MSNHHQRARTTVFSLGLMVQGVREGREVVSLVAEDFGVSERKVYKWLACYR